MRSRLPGHDKLLGLARRDRPAPPCGLPGCHGYVIVPSAAVRRSHRDRGRSHAENAESAEKNAMPTRSPRGGISNRGDLVDMAFSAVSAISARDPQRSRRETRRKKKGPPSFPGGPLRETSDSNLERD